MRSGQAPAFVLLALSLSSSTTWDGFVGLGAFFARSSMAGLWGAALALFVLAALLVDGRVRRFAGVLVLCLPLTAMLEVEAGSGDLWAAPAHVGAALGCWLWYWKQALTRIAPLACWQVGACSGATALLGVAWNHVIGGGGPGWVWDWIEAAPVCALFGSLTLTHLWGRTPGAAPSVLFGVSLQLGRNALTLSLHHAQAPLTGYPHWGGALAYSGKGGTAGLASSALCCLSLAHLSARNALPAPSRSCAAAAGIARPGSYLEHVGWAGCAFALSTVDWGAPSPASVPSRSALLLAGGWLLWRNARRRGRSGGVGCK